MNYTINLGAWNSVFAVPSVVVDEHIKMAGSAQLKVLLYLLRHGGETMDCELISSSVSLDKADVADALNYWIETGILQKNDGMLSPSTTECTQIQESLPPVMKETEPLPQKKFSHSTPTRPTAEECARLIQEREDIKQLVSQAQTILGTVLKRGDIDILVSIPDWTGLPASVVLMIISYCCSIGKKGIAYIEKVAISWSEAEIDTVEKADRKLSELSQKQNAWNRVRAILGIADRRATEKESAFCYTWIVQWRCSSDIIKEAYERCVHSTGKLSMSYMNKILERWQKSGVYTIDDIRQSDTAVSAGKANRPAPVRKTSYDINEIEQKLTNSTLNDWGKDT